jgi:hypothetical protein
MKKLILASLLVASLSGCDVGKVYTYADNTGSVTLSHLSVTPQGHLRGVSKFTATGQQPVIAHITDSDYDCTVIDSNNWSCNGFLAQKLVLTDGNLARVGGNDGNTFLFNFNSSISIK